MLSLLRTSASWYRRLTGQTAAVSEEWPLRAELFGVAQLESHARLLAAGHDVASEPGPELLLERLAVNAERIQQAYAVVASAVAQGRQVAPAADWLLDNSYLIEDQIEIARDHLPPGYSRELPRLRGGVNRGLPRVYDLALELVAHTDGRLDAENLSAFVRAYQESAALTLGELWAVPIMLRLALLEGVRRMAQRIAARGGTAIWRTRGASGF